MEVDFRKHPKISIITPSFNQGEYIEETILSVIDQGYPNLEYIIIDGGSNDNTVEIIRKYESKIAFWVSEPDSGQPAAINKGLYKSTGEIIGFINSDDCYQPGSLQFVADRYNAGYKWIIGSVLNFRMEGSEEYLVRQIVDLNLFNWLMRINQNHQPGNFWSRQIFKKIGMMDETLQYSFDWDYWLKMITAGFEPVAYNDKIVARFRLHEESKTVKYWSRFDEEYIILINRYKDLLSETQILALDNEIRRLRINEQIKMGKIESVNGKFRKSFSHFTTAARIKPTLIFSPEFIFQFLKATSYMPIRKWIQS